MNVKLHPVEIEGFPIGGKPISLRKWGIQEEWAVIYRSDKIRQIAIGWGRIIRMNPKNNSVVILEEPLKNKVYCYLHNIEKYDSREEARKKFEVSYRA